MRIELNAGGLSSGVAIADFHSDFDLLLRKARKTVSSFQTIKSFTYNMNGGVGILQDAVNQIESRITAEETKVAVLEQVQKKTNDFIEHVKQTDLKVSGLVSQNKQEFYNLNPWAKPPPPPQNEEKKWYQKVGDWFCEKGEQIRDGFNRVKDAVVACGKFFADTVSKAWNNIVTWYEENKDFIKQIAIEIAIGAAVIGLAVLTGGTSLAITVAIAAGTGAALGGIGGAIDYYAENGTLKGASKSVIGGAAKGFMTGSISGYVGGQVGIAGKALKLGRGATTLVGAASNGVASMGGETIHSLTDGKGITNEEKKKIAKSGITGFITGGFGAYKSYGKETTLDKLRANKEFTNKTINSIKENAVKNMRQGIPNSIYNAQEAIRDLSAFNQYLMKDMVKEQISSKMTKGIGKKIIKTLLRPTIVT